MKHSGEGVCLSSAETAPRLVKLLLLTVKGRREAEMAAVRRLLLGGPRLPGVPACDKIPCHLMCSAPLAVASAWPSISEVRKNVAFPAFLRLYAVKILPSCEQNVKVFLK